MSSSTPGPDLLTQEALSAKTADALRELCRDAGVSSSGRKNELIARLLQSRQFRIRSQADPSPANQPAVAGMRLRRPERPERTRLLPVQPNLLPPRRRSPPSRRPSRAELPSPAPSPAPLDPRLHRSPAPPVLTPDLGNHDPHEDYPMIDIDDDYEPVPIVADPRLGARSDDTPMVKSEPLPARLEPASFDVKPEPFDGFAVAFVCHSNLNRSMEAHYVCMQADPFQNGAKNIKSYGAGGRVNLPGTTANNPHVFDFGVAGYADIQKTLMENDRDQFYTRMGVMKMIDRNLRVKPKPERWQDERRHFNLIVCFEQRIFDIVLEDISSRRPVQHRLAHVVNIETPDNFTSAKVGGTLSCQLIEMIAKSPDWEGEFPALLGIIEQTVQLQHAVVFY